MKISGPNCVFLQLAFCNNVCMSSGLDGIIWFVLVEKKNFGFVDETCIRYGEKDQRTDSIRSKWLADVIFDKDVLR